MERLSESSHSFGINKKLAKKAAAIALALTAGAGLGFSAATLTSGEDLFSLNGCPTKTTIDNLQPGLDEFTFTGNKAIVVGNAYLDGYKTFGDIDPTTVAITVLNNPSEFCDVHTIQAPAGAEVIVFKQNTPEDNFHENTYSIYDSIKAHGLKPIGNNINDLLDQQPVLLVK